MMTGVDFSSQGEERAVGGAGGWNDWPCQGPLFYEVCWPLFFWLVINLIVFRNHLGTYECKLCLTLHNNEASYLAHTQACDDDIHKIRWHNEDNQDRHNEHFNYPGQEAPEQPGQASGQGSCGCSGPTCATETGNLEHWIGTLLKLKEEVFQRLLSFWSEHEITGPEGLDWASSDKYVWCSGCGYQEVCEDRPAWLQGYKTEGCREWPTEPSVRGGLMKDKIKDNSNIIWYLCFPW